MNLAVIAAVGIKPIVGALIVGVFVVWATGASLPRRWLDKTVGAGRPWPWKRATGPSEPLVLDSQLSLNSQPSLDSQASLDSPDLPEPLDRLRWSLEFQAKSRSLRSMVPQPRPLVSVSANETRTVRLRRRRQTVRLGRRRTREANSGHSHSTATARPRWEEPKADEAKPFVRLLGPNVVEGLGTRPTTQQLAFVALLVTRGAQSKDRLIDALWDGKAVSDSRFANLVAEVRAIVGRERLQYTDKGQYQIVDVDSDIARFKSLVSRSEVASSVSAVTSSVDALSAALSLIRGAFYEHRTSRYWRWLDDDHHLQHEIRMMIVDTAVRLADTETEQANVDNAIWACRQGLLAVPDEDQLDDLLATLYHRRHDNRYHRQRSVSTD